MKLNMEFTEVSIPAGSILFERKYPWHKRLWAKITGKKLQHNVFTLAIYDSYTLVDSDTSDKILTACPKKNYSKKEKAQLEGLIPHNGFRKPVEITDDSDELVAIVNAIRPGTLESHITEALDSKYYTVMEW